MNEKLHPSLVVHDQPRFLCRCSHCDELREIPCETTTSEEMQRAVLPWVFSLRDPPIVQRPRMVLTCDRCAKKIYGEELYNEAVATIHARKPN